MLRQKKENRPCRAIFFLNENYFRFAAFFFFATGFFVAFFTTFLTAFLAAFFFATIVCICDES